MSSFCVSSDKKQANFSFIPNRMKKWVIFDTMAYQRLPEYQIRLHLLKVNELWKFQMSSFCISIGETHGAKRAILFVSSVLTQNNDIWNFAAHWLWIKANQFDILETFGIPLYQMTHFFILFEWEKKIACFGLSVSLVLTQNEDIWNFHGLLTLKIGN